MTKFYGALAWSFGSLAATLLMLATLSVPMAMADSPDPPFAINCANDCACSTPVDVPCYNGKCAAAVVVGDVTVPACGTSCGCTGPDSGGNACYCVGP